MKIKQIQEHKAEVTEKCRAALAAVALAAERLRATGIATPADLLLIDGASEILLRTTKTFDNIVEDIRAIRMARNPSADPTTL